MRLKLTQAGLLFIFLLAVGVTATAGDKLMMGERQTVPVVEGNNKVHYPCLKPHPKFQLSLPVEREHPWSLPKQALAAEFLDTIKILVLRYDFQYEAPDDPNTTGRGRMNLAIMDSAAVVDSAGHYIDPPPHDANYFNSHMRALKEYYEIVSEQKITLEWEIWPKTNDSVYTLPQPMSYYGRCDFSDVIAGLEEYFRDCIRLADTVSPDINFSEYESFFLFHAGSDRQNDIGFPETCNDLFTGYINYFNPDTVFVDNDSTFIQNALLMPETASQDNRATALNAVMAHEFGHQLGLVDLYSTATFMSQLGDFALMDNNGFGTGIDFGFPVGRVFGAIPLFPCAWSRAFLGFVDVVDYREGADIEVVAAEVISNGVKVARVPISDKEYYLIENRLVESDGFATGSQVDSLTNVILGPAYRDPGTQNITRSTEYDFLMPGSGLLIYHVDERVAGLDYNYDGESNFDDNQLQWIRDINGVTTERFIKLVEADGFVNFGGYYRAGYGSEEDMFRDDRNDELTPYTNPNTIDNTGNNSHIFIQNIERKWDSTGFTPVRMDSVIQFDVSNDRMVHNFPVRAGYPQFGISPIAADLNEDGQDELIVTSGDLLSVVTETGETFISKIDTCATCVPYMDSSYASVHPGRLNPVPLYAKLIGDAYTNPVVCDFPDYTGSGKLLAIGTSGAGGSVQIYRAEDGNDDGEADIAGPIVNVTGNPLALTFDTTNQLLYILTDAGWMFYRDSLSGFNKSVQFYSTVDSTKEFHGMARAGNGVVTLVGNATTSRLYYIVEDVALDISHLQEYITLGPIVVDLDRDGLEEVIVCSEDGLIVALTVDPNASQDYFLPYGVRQTDFMFRGNPIAGDADLDGYPDIIVGGVNYMYSFNREFLLTSDFPKEIDDRYPLDYMVAAPIMANLSYWSAIDANTDKPEIAFGTTVGNIYSIGAEETFGFPLSGGELGIGSPVFMNGQVDGRFGYLGLDGWFYLWRVDQDTQHKYWPMAGADQYGSFNFNESLLSDPPELAIKLPEERFYNYPNPVTTGETTIRYYLGSDASSVALTIYDFSGREIVSLEGTTVGQLDNEITWNCSDITPGVYRCKITADFNGTEETAFTDIAVIR